MAPQSNSGIWLMGTAEWNEINKREHAKKTASVMFTATLQQDMFVKPYRKRTGNWLPDLYLLPSNFHELVAKPRYAPLVKYGALREAPKFRAVPESRRTNSGSWATYY
jgi:hypothetical protein